MLPFVMNLAWNGTILPTCKGLFSYLIIFTVPGPLLLTRSTLILMEVTSDCLSPRQTLDAHIHPFIYSFSLSQVSFHVYWPKTWPSSCNPLELMNEAQTLKVFLIFLLPSLCSSSPSYSFSFSFDLLLRILSIF